MSVQLRGHRRIHRHVGRFAIAALRVRARLADRADGIEQDAEHHQQEQRGQTRVDVAVGRDLLHLRDRIEGANAGFRSLTESIDTTTPAGRMMMQMVGSFAEFERAMIRERTKAGLDQARSEGRIGGRRPKLNAKQRAEIAESVISGRKSAAEMARIFGVSQPTVSRIVALVRHG